MPLQMAVVRTCTAGVYSGNSKLTRVANEAEPIPVHTEEVQSYAEGDWNKDAVNMWQAWRVNNEYPGIAPQVYPFVKNHGVVCKPCSWDTGFKCHSAEM